MRITNQQIDAAQRDLTALLTAEAGRPVAVTLHRGNGTYKIANVLIVEGVQVWPNGIGGTTAADAYRGLKMMIAGVATISDIREDDQRKQARA